MQDDKVFGRDGTGMKGFVAVAVSLTSVFLKMKRMESVRYAFSSDEEVDCIGVPYLISHLKEHGIMAGGCITEKVRLAWLCALRTRVLLHGRLR